jgi:hypothetical protein
MTRTSHPIAGYPCWLRKLGEIAKHDMQYRVYSGPKGSADVSPIEKSQLLFKEFATLDDALSWARHLESTGRVSLLIEGDDGTRMNRRAIADALGVGMREQLDR